MSRISDDSNVTRREFLVGAGTMVTTGYLVIGSPSTAAVARSFPPRAPDHVMTFDVTQTPIACINNPPQSTGADPCVLSVNPKEVVHWRAITSLIKHKHRLAVLFIDRTPFVDKDGDKVWAFHGTDSDETNGIGRDASIDPTLQDGDYFEFSVAVWDEENANKIRSYTGDPTIMIGKRDTLIASALAKLSAANGLLQKAAAAYPAKSDDIKAIEDKLSPLIVQLKELLKGQAK
jgi:hypothetical protein